MKIIDTFPQIANCFADDIFNMEYWENYANAISPGLAAKLKEDIADYNFQKDVLPLLNNVAHHFPELEIAHQSFLLLTDGLAEKIQDTLQTNFNGSIIFYFGLCNGAGWATELDGNPVILLGVEKIIELSWYHKYDMAGLIYHELGHILHNQARLKIRKPFQNQDLWQLYCEGMAMLIEQLLLENKNFYHQDRDGWLNWCETNRPQLWNVFLHRISSAESTRDFFGDWNHYQGKSDIGYYLGCEMIKELSAKHSLFELANLEETDIFNQLKTMAP